jgi:hypothetical protein
VVSGLARLRAPLLGPFADYLVACLKSFYCDRFYFKRVFDLCAEVNRGAYSALGVVLGGVELYVGLVYFEAFPIFAASSKAGQD